MAKQLTEAHEFILALLTDKGPCHRQWIADMVKMRGHRVANRSINSLIERGLIEVDEDNYLGIVNVAPVAELTTPAALSIERVADAPVMDVAQEQQSYNYPEFLAKFFPNMKPEEIIAQPLSITAADLMPVFVPRTDYDVLKAERTALIDALADLYLMASEAPKTWDAGMFRSEIWIRVADVLSKIAPEALPDPTPEHETLITDLMLNSTDELSLED